MGTSVGSSGTDRHPFEEVSTTDPSAGRFAQLLAPDAIFRSPVFVHPVTGRDPVAEILETAHGIFGRPAYRLRLRDGPHTVLLFDGEVQGQALQGAVVLRRTRPAGSAS
jgi:hypothetical protein